MSVTFQMFQAAERTSVTLEFNVVTSPLQVLDSPVVRVHLDTMVTDSLVVPVVGPD